LEAQDYFKKDILPKLRNKYDFSKSMQPKAYFTGGLPGAGKSKIVKHLRKENPKIPVVDVDDLRKHHPNSEIIQKHFGINSTHYHCRQQQNTADFMTTTEAIGRNG